MSGKGNLNYGLNARNKRKKGLTGFGGDDSDSGSDGGGASAGAGGARSSINRDIAAEQAALRKRAKAAMAASALDTNVYDYDAEYDSFSSGKKKEDEARSAAAAARAKASSGGPRAKAQPKYITNLIKTAGRRNQEQEIVHERKVAKEQAEEDANEQYEGKDKFITSSYKRKLAEREQWAKDEAERSKREAEEDVTKKTGVGSFMFGGIGRSLLMGSGGKKSDEADATNNDRKSGEDMHNQTDDRGSRRNGSNPDDAYQHRESSRETERWGNTSGNRRYDSREQNSDRKRPLPPAFGGGKNTGATSNKKDTPENTVKTRHQILEERGIKIRDARERYFTRRGIATQ